MLRLGRRCNRAVTIGTLRLFQLLNFLLKNLIEHGGLLSPRFAFGLAFSGVSGYFTTVDIGKTLSLALEFCAQFVFGHVIKPVLDDLN
jgi:hypothetical protein